MFTRVTEKCIDYSLALGENKCIYTQQEIEFLGLEIKGNYKNAKKCLRKNKKILDKITDRKQLENF